MNLIKSKAFLPFSAKGRRDVNSK
jgi:hypothetical protein